MLKGGRNVLVAALFSLIIPGLGQVYNSEYQKALLFLFGAIIGYHIFLIPGVIIWLYGIYDAYAGAQKLNDREVPYRESSRLYLAGFVLFSIIMVFVLSLFFITVFNPIVFHINPPRGFEGHVEPGTLMVTATSIATVSPTITIAQKDIVIISATYGYGTKQMDVTKWLQGKVAKLPVNISVTNTNIGSDPAYGSLKYLVIKYRINGEEKTANVTENQYLTLP